MFKLHTNSASRSGKSIALLGLLVAASGYALLAPSVASAATCILDTNGNGTVDSGDGSLGADDTSGNPSSNLACGEASAATGGQATAIGTFSKASGSQSTAAGYQATATGPQAVAIGNSATANATGAIAVGNFASASGVFSVALGIGASASANNSVALGQGSVTDREGTVSVGAAGKERQITNVAAGTLGTDAVNLDQLNIVDGHAQDAAFAAFLAQTSANTALAQNVLQDSRITAAEAVNTAQGVTLATHTTQISTLQGQVNTQATTISAIQALDAQQNGRLTSLEAVQLSLAGRVGSLESQVVTNYASANGGIAAAMALGGTVMPADAKFALSFNLSTYRGEQGFSISAVVRASDHVYVQGGIAGSSVKGSTGGRVGVTFAW